MNDFYHHHKKRIAPEEVSRRYNYVCRTGAYTGREDLVSTGVANLPTGIESAKEFCKLLSKNERKNGGMYEHEIAIPRDLPRDEQTRLAEQLAMELAGPSPVFWGLHSPSALREGGKQPHVHAVVYPKLPDGIPRAEPAEVFKRHNPVNPELGGWKKDCGGATRREVVGKLKEQRARSSATINHALERNGIEHRVDHRSYAERGIKKTPGQHLGPRRVRQEAPATTIAESCDGQLAHSRGTVQGTC